MKNIFLLAFFSSLLAQVTPITGTVTFMEGTSIVCTAPVVVSNATTPPTFSGSCSTSSLSSGSHTLTSIYSGDANYAGSTSKPFVEIVNPVLIPTISTLTGTPNPSTAGQAITFTDTVTH